MSITLSLFTDEIYILDDAWARRLPAQYMHAIMQHGIEYNIVNVANQLSFAYQSLTPKLRVFVSPLTESIKAANFIHTLKKKQKVWHEMMTNSVRPKYYNLV